jgi:hypothetical protein
MRGNDLLEHVLTSDDPIELSLIAQKLAPDLLARLDEVVPSARQGSPTAIRSYVRTWRALEERTLTALHDAEADFVVETDHGFMLADAKGAPSQHLTEVLEQEALHAPFSIWVQALGDSSGIAVHLIAAVKRLTGRRLVNPPRRLVQPLLFAEASESLDPRRFLRLAHRELETEADSLERVADVFALSDTALGRVFGVSRQRIAQWRADGVPLAHRSRLTAIEQIADLLEGNLLPERIPGIARTPAPAFDNESLLEALEHGRHLEVLRRVEDSFDWAKTA